MQQLATSGLTLTYTPQDIAHEITSTVAEVSAQQLGDLKAPDTPVRTGVRKWVPAVEAKPASDWLLAV